MIRALVIEGDIAGGTGTWIDLDLDGLDQLGYLLATHHAPLPWSRVVPIGDEYAIPVRTIATLVAPRTYLLREEDGTESTVYLSRSAPFDPWGAPPAKKPENKASEGEPRRIFSARRGGR